MLVTLVQLQCWLLAAKRGVQTRLDRRSEQGQATAEYALVLLGAAAVAIFVGVWAKGSGGIGRLLDAVLEQLMSKVR